MAAVALVPSQDYQPCQPQFHQRCRVANLDLECRLTPCTCHGYGKYELPKTQPVAVDVIAECCVITVEQSIFENEVILL